MTPPELFFDLGRAVLGAVPALISLAAAVVLVWAMIAYEHHGYRPGRDRLRREANAA